MSIQKRGTFKYRYFEFKERIPNGNESIFLLFAYERVGQTTNHGFHSKTEQIEESNSVYGCFLVSLLTKKQSKGGSPENN